MPLPTNELPLFAFPSGMRLVYNSLNRFPLPVFFTLVFTDVNGDHLYAACLRFYEAIDARELSAVFRKIYGAERVCPSLRFSRTNCCSVYTSRFLVPAESGRAAWKRHLLSEGYQRSLQETIL